MRDNSGYYMDNELKEFKEYNQEHQMRDFIATQMRVSTLDYNGTDDSREKGMELHFMYFRSQVDVIAGGLDVRQAEREL